MRVVERAERFEEELEGAKREAQAAFNSSDVMLEKYLTDPRHIEVQVLGDQAGNLIHLGERECSIQRRHQKVAEESPSPAISPAMRRKITSSALQLARKAGYSNAGTVEFIFQDGNYYFLEMNTRLQVEHPVTEQALNFDLVEAQIRIASGESLWVTQEDVEFNGHSIEARLYAEDPESGFLPSTGRITQLDAPYEGYGVRVDAGVSNGDTISPYYDPMIAKIITAGENRHEALVRMREMLGSMTIAGPRTNLDFLRWLFAHPQFELGNISTRFIERYYRPGAFAVAPTHVVLAGAALSLLGGRVETTAAGTQPGIWSSMSWRQARQSLGTTLLIEGRLYRVELSQRAGRAGLWRATIRQGEETLYEGDAELGAPDGAASLEDFGGTGPTVQIRLQGEGPRYSLECGYSPDGSEFYLFWEGREYWIRQAPGLSTERLNKSLRLRDESSLESPMPGKVLRVLVAAGDAVVAEQPLVIIEAMKMEFTVRAQGDGKVGNVHYAEGAQVAAGDVLVEMEK